MKKFELLILKEERFLYDINKKGKTRLVVDYE
jgi:hypothetical protein